MVSRKTQLEMGRAELWWVGFHASARSMKARFWRYRSVGLEALQHAEKASKSQNKVNAATESPSHPIATAKLDSVRSVQAVRDDRLMLFSYHSGYGPRSRVFTVYRPWWVL